jgi:hypothetical protein
MRNWDLLIYGLDKLEVFRRAQVQNNIHTQKDILGF